MNSIYGRCEDRTLVAISDDASKIKKWIEDQLCEPYRDDNRWNKVFKKGSPLECYNMPYNLEEDIHCNWINEEDFQNFVYRNSHVFRLLEL